MCIYLRVCACVCMYVNVCVCVFVLLVCLQCVCTLTENILTSNTYYTLKKTANNNITSIIKKEDGVNMGKQNDDGSTAASVQHPDTCYVGTLSQCTDYSTMNPLTPDRS